jgi:hypothetical protein
MGLNIQNLYTQNISFEATAMSLQGHHLTVRCEVPVGQTVALDKFMPLGMTFEMLAQSQAVINEFNRVGGARYALIPTPNTNQDVNLSAFSGLGATQAAAATVASPGLYLGTANRAGQAIKLRLTTQKAVAVGESWAATALNQNGVLVPGFTTLTIPASSAARFFIDEVLVNVPVNDGDVFELVVAYTAGGGPTMGAVRAEVTLAYQ